jgi:hypothetical protein
LVAIMSVIAFAAATPEQRRYKNRLTPIRNASPILADFPQFVAPVREARRFEAPILVDDEGADLDVRAWRFSYNARGIIEIPNRLRADRTALIVVHPWGIDDGQGWRTPEPAGVCDFCTPEKNALSHEHIKKVLNPFLQSLRGKVALVMYSQRNAEDEVLKKMYRSIRSKPGEPTEEQRRQGAAELRETLNGFVYKGAPLPGELSLSVDRSVIDYFAQFGGLLADAPYNPKGFWELPVPVVKAIDVHPDDVVIYDPDGYEPLKRFLQRHEIRHVLLAGYATDMCYRDTTAGYKNLSKDFNVFLVGDATMATFPANDSPRHATNAAISFASLEQLITQVSWIRYTGEKRPGR